MASQKAPPEGEESEKVKGKKNGKRNTKVGKTHPHN